MATVNLLPDAEGIVQQWDVFPTPDPPPPHWSVVDDPVGSPNEDTDYVYTKVSKEEEAFNHETSALLTGAIITNVRVTVRARATTMFLTEINIGIRVGVVTRYAGTSWLLATWYADQSWDWADNPATGNPWTKFNIDNLQSSIKMVSSAVTARVTQVYLTVTYHIPTPAVAGKGLVSWTP